MDFTTVLLATAAMAGLYMAWNIGANDVANAMGTSVGSGALTLRRAVVLAAVFEFGGAMLVGGRVTRTIATGIVDVEAFVHEPMVLGLGMTCCLIAAAVWLNIATQIGWPVSTTHSIVGAVLGFGLVAVGASGIDWWTMASIVASWVISPLLGGVLAFALFLVLKRRVLGAEQPLSQMRVWGPLMVLPIFGLLTLAVLYEGLAPLDLDVRLDEAVLIGLGVGVVGSLAMVPVFQRLTVRVEGLSVAQRSQRIERVFAVLQVITACFVAFAHGSNDVANAIGPLVAVFESVSLDGVSAEVHVPTNLLLVGALGIVIGLATYGTNVISTIGREITHLTPSRGFTAEFAAATTIMVASKLGLPVSTTHTLVGAVVGVGFARSLGAVDFRTVRGIVGSWLITVPFTASVSAVLFLSTRPLL